MYVGASKTPEKYDNVRLFGEEAAQDKNRNVELMEWLVKKYRHVLGFT